MRIMRLNIPSSSILENYLSNPDYSDSYGACLAISELEIQEIYLRIFGVTPWWFKQLFNIRNKIVSFFGLIGPSYEEMFNVEIKSQYKIGEKIGLFLLYSLTKNEIITGADDKHLNFRVSVQKTIQDNSNTVVISTVVKFNNIFGKLYLFLIKPFHKFIIKKLLQNAINNKQ